MGGRINMKKRKNDRMEMEIGELLDEADLELKEGADEKGLKETKRQIQEQFMEGTIDQKYEE